MTRCWSETWSGSRDTSPPELFELLASGRERLLGQAHRSRRAFEILPGRRLRVSGTLEIASSLVDLGCDLPLPLGVPLLLSLTRCRSRRGGHALGPAGRRGGRGNRDA